MADPKLKHERRLNNSNFHEHLHRKLEAHITTSLEIYRQIFAHIHQNGFHLMESTYESVEEHSIQRWIVSGSLLLQPDQSSSPNIYSLPKSLLPKL